MSVRDGTRVERICAWTAVALVHAGLAWVAMQWRTPAPAAGDESVLAVIFIDRRPPPAPAAEPRPPPSRPARVAAPAAAAAGDPVRTRSATPSPDAEPAAPEPTSGLTAVQLGAAAPVRAPWDEPAVDLLERRAPGLPGHATQRFKMQAPRSVATVLERAGQLFGGRGEDPCKRTRANIDGLGAQGDSADLQRELEYERRYCRP